MGTPKKLIDILDFQRQQALALPHDPQEFRRRRESRSAEWALRDQLHRWRRQLQDLPAWSWARFDNSAWRLRCNPLAIEAAAKWQPGRGPLVMLGPTGSGKSSSLVARLHQLAAGTADAIKAGRKPVLPRRVRWTTEAMLLRAERGFRLGSGTCPEVLYAMRARVLVIDEVGQFGGERLMAEIVIARKDRGLVTVITTGLTKERLIAQYGAAMHRRLVEGGEAVDMHWQTRAKEATR